MITIYKKSTFLIRAANDAKAIMIRIISQGTALTNLMVTNKSRPTKEANIPLEARVKSFDWFSRSRNGAVTTSRMKEGVKIARLATRAPEMP